MKIAIDISQIAYPGSGVANYTRDLVGNLLKQDGKNRYLLFGYSLRKKHILDIFLRDLRTKYENLECRTFSLPQSLVNYIGNKVHKIPLESVLGKIDIYHSSDWIQFSSQAKKITTVHDLIVYRFPETSDPVIIKTQKQRLFHVVNECQKIIVDSNSTKADLIKILNVEENRINVVYPGTSLNFSGINRKSIKTVLAKHNLRKPFVLAIGKNDPRKNLEGVIKAYEKSDIKADLVVVTSKGWGSELNPSKDVHLIYEIGNSELSILYSCASMLVYPSFYEGFGLPVIEANSAGCPVITSAGGSLKEVAGDAAFFVDPYNVDEIAEMMRQLFNDKNLQKKLSLKGLINAKRFTWEIGARKIISLYESL